MDIMDIADLALSTVVIAIAFYVLSVLLSTLYFEYGKIKWFYHDIMGWCVPDDEDDGYFDGCSVHAKCKHCGRGIMQDSQGNWF